MSHFPRALEVQVHHTRTFQQVTHGDLQQGPFPTLHFGDLYIASGADTSDVPVWIDCPLVPGGVGLVHLLVPCDVRRSMSQLGISQRTQGPPREGGWGVIRALAGSHAAASYLFVPFVSFCGLGWTWTG